VESDGEPCRAWRPKLCRPAQEMERAKTASAVSAGIYGTTGRFARRRSRLPRPRPRPRPRAPKRSARSHKRGRRKLKPALKAAQSGHLQPKRPSTGRKRLQWGEPWGFLLNVARGAEREARRATMRKACGGRELRSEPDCGQHAAPKTGAPVLPHADPRHLSGRVGVGQQAVELGASGRTRSDRANTRRHEQRPTGSWRNPSAWGGFWKAAAG
jgi:hypothetical protein